LSDTLILQQAELKKYPLASKKAVVSVQNWHENHGNLVIAPEEQEYLSHDLDLFPLARREKTPLRKLLERSRRFRIHSVWRKKKVPELPVYDADTVKLLSDKRIDRFITAITMSIGSAMLIAPMWVLQALDDPSRKLAVITAFIVVFLGMVSYATVAKPPEILAATAA
jgi:hypothetical protein